MVSREEKNRLAEAIRSGRLKLTEQELEKKDGLNAKTRILVSIEKNNGDLGKTIRDIAPYFKQDETRIQEVFEGCFPSFGRKKTRYLARLLQVASGKPVRELEKQHGLSSTTLNAYLILLLDHLTKPEEEWVKRVGQLEKGRNEIKMNALQKEIHEESLGKLAGNIANEFAPAKLNEVLGTSGITEENKVERVRKALTTFFNFRKYPALPIFPHFLSGKGLTSIARDFNVTLTKIAFDRAVLSSLIAGLKDREGGIMRTLSKVQKYGFGNVGRDAAMKGVDPESLDKLISLILQENSTQELGRKMRVEGLTDENKKEVVFHRLIWQFANHTLPHSDEVRVPKEIFEKIGGHLGHRDQLVREHARETKKITRLIGR